MPKVWLFQTGPIMEATRRRVDNEQQSHGPTKRMVEGWGGTGGASWKRKQPLRACRVTNSDAPERMSHAAFVGWVEMQAVRKQVCEA